MCPRCGEWFSPPRAALSRDRDGVYVCPDCGRDEAAEAMLPEGVPHYPWASERIDEVNRLEEEVETLTKSYEDVLEDYYDLQEKLSDSESLVRSLSAELKDVKQRYMGMFQGLAVNENYIDMMERALADALHMDHVEIKKRFNPKWSEEEEPSAGHEPAA